MTRIVVDVMPRPELLDPQGQAIGRALTDLGLPEIRDVRAGKRFVLELAGPPSADLLDRAERLAGELLANPVIEDYRVHVDDGAPDGDQPPRGSGG